MIGWYVIQHLHYKILNNKFNEQKTKYVHILLHILNKYCIVIIINEAQW